MFTIDFMHAIQCLQIRLVCICGMGAGSKGKNQQTPPAADWAVRRAKAVKNYLIESHYQNQIIN